jgi:DNA polymerase zeta
VDAEALGLLSWLASSQAAEELTSDDELINEVILSPLFAKKSIEVALKSAHLDFDSASQQECQDILDSVDHVIPAEEQNSHTSLLSTVKPDSNYSLGSTIPQVDGSSDENPKVSQEYDRSKITRRTAESPSYTSTKNSSKSAGKRAGTEHLWGSLPIFNRKKSCRTDDDGSGSAMQPLNDLSTSLKSTTEKNTLATTGNTVKESSSFVGEDDSVSRSVRDLMRRRRSIRPVQLEFDTVGTAPYTMDKESETTKSGESKFHDFTRENSNSKTPCSRDEYLRMTFAQMPPLKNQLCSDLESTGSERHECKFLRESLCYHDRI